ncbi:MAG: M4 family metallopeptidase [Bacteroidota bacterium]
MKIRILVAFFFLCSLQGQLWGQKVIPEKQGSPALPTIDQMLINSQQRTGLPQAQPNFLSNPSLNFEALPQPEAQRTQAPLVVRAADTQLPIMIRGELAASQLRSGASIDEQVKAYLAAAQGSLGIEAPEAAFAITGQLQDAEGRTHIRLQQLHQGIPVYGSELILHSKDGRPYLLNGRYYPSPELAQLRPSRAENEAIEVAKNHLSKLTNYRSLKYSERHLVDGEQEQAELVVYHLNGKAEQERLAWYLTLRPNLVERWEYFVDAQSGALLHHFHNGCKLYHEFGDLKAEGCTHTHKHAHETADFRLTGSETATAIDLSGNTRLLNVYESSGTYFMIDAAREMFNDNLSNFPDNPVGTIWSIDASNTSPQNNNFSISQITSGNNLWNNRTAVSAHFNGGEAYDYFRTTFNRNSINGEGGNIVSIINVTDEDGSDMDNAFWNGAAMFYGNGNVAFNAPLAKALDVAGHEMSHGVIQNSANLVYENQPGALNESFADIFGAMIDRDDWKIGEEVANPSVFPSGTMRDMQNPNNGGSQFGDRGWQPKHMDEFVNLPNTPQGNNGGVHINSGIPNHAYYLFATDAAVGRSKAEQIYYDALTQYLTRSSQFIDLRLAVIEAATVRHGGSSAEVAAARRAFDQVGIGGGSGTTTQEEVGINPGQDFVLWSDDQLQSINNATTAGTPDGTFSNTNHISKPSLTDDGSIILFVDQSRNLREIDVNWTTGTVIDEFILEQSVDWRNVATSRDGNRLAAVLGNLNDGIFNDSIFVFDFVSGEARYFELFNPTTSQGGNTTGDVLFADALEFDFSGEFVMYDAANRIDNNNGSNITYWDIGFVKVWDNATNTFGSGQVNKLFSGLGENQSVGNPTFAKNAPFIVAFDLIENDFFGNPTYSIMGANIETGDLGTIFEGNTLGYPNYSKDDDRVIFSFDQNGVQPIVAIRGVQSNRIEGQGDATVFIENANWGVWFATGERDLTVNTDDLQKTEGSLLVYPNPTDGELNVLVEAPASTEALLSVVDPLGRVLLKERHKLISGTNYLSPHLDNLMPGTYFVLINMDNKLLTARVLRQQ